MILVMEINPTKIRELRTGRGLSVRGLAREAGVSTETVYSLEHSRRDFIWPRTAKKLAEALGVEAKDLFA
jgi:transcriptional regulator with XRE-family HTH domain